MLLKLGAHVAFDGVMSAVVGSRGDLIDVKPTFAVKEHFHGQESHKFHGSHHLKGELARLGFLRGGDVGRRHEVVDQVDFWVEHRFHHGIDSGLALRVSSDNDAQFFVDVHRLFEDARRIKTTFEGVCLCPQHLDPFSVVSACSQLLHDRVAHDPNFVQ